jgi:hypothetical protein
MQQVVLRNAAPVLSGTDSVDRIQMAKQLLYVQLIPQALREMLSKVSRTDVVHFAIGLTMCNLAIPSKVFDTERVLCSFLRDALAFCCSRRNVPQETIELCKSLLPYFILFPAQRRAPCIAEVFCSSDHELTDFLVGSISSERTVIQGVAFPHLLTADPSSVHDMDAAAHIAARIGHFRVSANMWVQLWNCMKNTNKDEAMRFILCAVDVVMSQLASTPTEAVADYAFRLGNLVQGGVDLPPARHVNFFALCTLVRVSLLLNEDRVEEALEAFRGIEWIPSTFEDIPNKAQKYTSEAADITVDVLRHVLSDLLDKSHDLYVRSPSHVALRVQNVSSLLYRWAVSTTRRNGQDFTSSLTKHQRSAFIS